MIKLNGHTERLDNHIELLNGKKHHNGNGRQHNGGEADWLGDDHVATSIETPMRDDAFAMSDEAKITQIEKNFEQIMLTLGLDLSDDSLRGTPHRVAKMYVQEIFRGLNPENKPAASIFENKFRYGQILVEKSINLNSTCEHHFLPIFGKAHVGYVAKGGVIGLSKINRIVDYFARRPQVQERLTMQIANELKRVLNTEDVAVVIEAKHLCVSCRGIQDESSTTLTAEYSGIFQQDKRKEEFLSYIGLKI